MCGRYTLTDPHDLQLRFEIEGTSETAIVPRFNVSPSQLVPVVVERPEGRALETMRWGFQPAWMKDAPRRPPPINARAETLLERPLFRGAVARGRCLIPADGFFEWMTRPGTTKKQPVFIHLKDGDLFGFAGIYTRGADEAATCAIITTTANDLLAPVHERMPVILARDEEAVWLDPTLADPAAVLGCLRPYPSEPMEWYPVSSLVSSARNEGPELIAPLPGLTDTSSGQPGLPPR